MITLIKFLVILFISLLGYDTINLFIQNHTNEDLDLGKCAADEEVHLENITWDFWALCLATTGTIIFLYRSWQRSRHLAPPVPDILMNLEFVSDTRTNETISNRISDVDNVRRSAQLRSQSNSDSNEDNTSSIASSSSLKEKSLGITDILIEKMLSEPSMPQLEELQEIDSNLMESDSYNVLEEINPVRPESLSKRISEPSSHQQIAIENDSKGRLIINYAQLNEARGPYSNERTPFSFILPDTRSSNAVTRCDCNVSKLEERLELVENGLKSTERITVLWRNRIEQTEEELLELQQQIHCILLDWSIKKCSVNYVNKDDIDTNMFKESSTLSTTFGASYKPLQIINEIIEESRKEEENDHQKEQELEQEKLVRVSRKTTVPVKKPSITSTKKPVTVLCYRRPAEVVLKPSELSVVEVLDKADSDHSFSQKEDQRFIKQYTEINNNAISDSELFNRKSRAAVIKHNSTPPVDEEQFEAAVELSFSISEPYSEPNNQYREKIELLQRNEELKNETEHIVKEIETVLKNDETLRTINRKFKTIQARVPSHVVSPRSTIGRKQPPSRRSTRSGYSVSK